MLIGMLLGDPDLELVTIKNQSSQEDSVPDAELSGNFRILIETKVVANAVDEVQLRNHFNDPSKDPFPLEKTKLILLTPDAHIPEQVPKDLPITWLNFDDLVQALNELEEASFLSEKELFFLHNFREYLREEGLLSAANNRVIVIPAGMAWEEYEACNAYVCQDKRSFKPSSRLAFYKGGEIMPRIPAILKVFDSVYFPDHKETFNPEKHIILPSDNKGLSDKTKQHLADVVAYWSEKRDEYGKYFKVFLLSPFDKEENNASSNDEDKKTYYLSKPVEHKRNSEGKLIAYVQRQRYVDFESLKKAKTTDDLKDAKE